MSRGDLVLALPGDPATRTGGYLYDARLVAELRAIGWQVEILGLGDGFPLPSTEQLAQAEAALAGVADGRLVLIDGLGLGVMPQALAREARRLRLVGLVHHPIGWETGLEAATAESLVASETEALRHVREVIVTSPTTGRDLAASFGVPPERITVAVPGTDPAPLARGSDLPAPLLLAVGSVIPRKDFPGLVAALTELRGLAWRLMIVGSLTRDEAEAARLRDAVSAAGLSNRIELTGELDTAQLDVWYDRADLVVSSSRYEGFGMALAEALARGLPIVAVAGGAVAEWMPRDAALLVPPDRADGLTEALRSVLSDPGRHRRLREGAVAARPTLPTWKDTAAIVADVLARASA